MKYAIPRTTLTEGCIGVPGVRPNFATLCPQLPNLQRLAQICERRFGWEDKEAGVSGRFESLLWKAVCVRMLSYNVSNIHRSHNLGSDSQLHTSSLVTYPDLISQPSPMSVSSKLHPTCVQALKSFVLISQLLHSYPPQVLASIARIQRPWGIRTIRLLIPNSSPHARRGSLALYSNTRRHI
jgi:hypothetical protein